MELQNRLQEMCELAKQELLKAQCKQKKYYDVKSKERMFQPGDNVLILLPSEDNILLMQWKGPFGILERKNGHDYRVQLKDRVRMFHANVIKKYNSREKEDSEIQQMAAVIVEDQKDTEISTNQEFELQTEQRRHSKTSTSTQSYFNRRGRRLRN